MAENWSREEVEAAVADYLAMLASELGGEPYNKAAHNRALQQVLIRRTHGSHRANASEPQLGLNLTGMHK
jgi:hypothetical protein